MADVDEEITSDNNSTIATPVIPGTETHDRGSKEVNL